MHRVEEANGLMVSDPDAFKVAVQVRLELALCPTESGNSTSINRKALSVTLLLSTSVPSVECTFGITGMLSF